MKKYCFNKQLSVVQALLIIVVILLCSSAKGEPRTKGILPPPDLAVLDDFATPFEDPLKSYPKGIDLMQVPSNIYSNAGAECATADHITQANNPELAMRRLLEAVEKEQEKEEGANADAKSVNTLRSQHLPKLSLQTVLDLGLCHNPQVRGTWSQVKLQASRIGQARAAYLPKVSTGIMMQRGRVRQENSRTSSTVISQSSNSFINLSWRLIDFGERSFTLESAYFQLAGSIYSQNEVLQNTIIQILQSYYEAQTNRSIWFAQKEMRALAEQILASAQRRVTQGVGSRNDALQAKSSLARAKLEEERSKGEYEKTLATLTYLVGLPANTHFDLDESLELEIQQLNNPQINAQQKIIIQQNLQEWLDQSKRTHPAIAAARAQWLAAEADVQSVSAQGLPTVDLSANYYRNGRPTDSVSNVRSSERTLSLTINIPLFTGFEHTYRVRGAQAIAEQKRMEMEAIEQQTMLNIVHAQSDAQTAWNSLNAANEYHLSAIEATDSAQRMFEKGVIDITQVIQAQNGLVEANMQRIQAHAKWQSARLTLIIMGYAWDLTVEI